MVESHPETSPVSGDADLDSAATLNVRSKASVIHIGSLDSFDITEGGKAAAREILDYLDTGREESLRRAIDIYDDIIPNENFGGEYTALQWISRLFLAPETQKTNFLSYPLVASWVDLLVRDDYANLRDYLKLKYHFVDDESAGHEAKEKLRFLEDFILFNNPDRERWDKIGENIYQLGIKEGDSVIDFGCGPGYFTFKFANIVGRTGHVYGIETNEQHINFANDYIRQYQIGNVGVYQYRADGWGLDKPVKAEVIFLCSLYHILYAAFTDRERDLFIEHIKRYLKEDGRLIIVDNDLVEGTDLPYHGPYISRDMIISQLWHYGFELLLQYQFTAQRYILEFKQASKPRAPADPPPAVPAVFADEASVQTIKITSPLSLIRYRMIGTASQGYTVLGKKAARLFFGALESRDETGLAAALTAYRELIPQERIGDEYTVFEWFCRYLLAPEEKQAEMLADSLDAEYFHTLADDDFALLKKYLRIKYDLAQPDPEMPGMDDTFARRQIHDVIYEYSGNEVSFDQLNEWNEFISFNNPNRDSWEKTGKMLDYLNIREGESVADIGCGFGFFSFKFARMVGKTGRVYSTEINRNALAYVETARDKFGLNIEAIQARLNDAGLPPDSVDTIFMCSMYHAVYIASLEFVKDEFILSLKRALRKGGRLVVVDNAITPPSIVAYFGSAIAKELVISQLKYYGFRLVDSRQFVPQRYVLVFQQD
ncbi:MAG: methyltransferase domain-containing protein [Methanoculleus sp.]|uniref:class I SAM-dependent methyltransferase n=1 Tax=unclassified Methanoculleus TaxID=2619537 RepID=UPI0025D8656B|nr:MULTISPECIES: class I SAM-dependent methyltransferase [unclassified Methanoculleus]MCK9317208.1 methyltransferase domain-containing protein [Methanoculleus sp.]MDD2255069.1 methyltransferase domain-containing protein [Methanoculleus sp.]MDD3215460.1 methyltransferase domain-containing protein [Methanoculleus sp.]MDD4315401.1 methyltransferase domain-containing protein [Methanoculleus sp.]MDD4472037.1 methyltransferase domain-containing protein [Methanoculleus sp.]